MTVSEKTNELNYTNLTDKEKKKLIVKAVKPLKKYFDIIFPGWEEDPNMSSTPERFTKAFVEDIAKSLYTPFPRITAFDNIEKYSGIVLQANIPVQSLCSHHLQNIVGLAHVAYIPGKKIIGLSKLNRITEYLSRRPQVQENLTQQIHDTVKFVCEGTAGVAVVIKAKHNCVGHRGINQNSDMSTAVLSGAFREDPEVREEFYELIALSNKK